MIAAALFAVGCVTEGTGTKAELAADTGAANADGSNAGGSLAVTNLTSNRKGVAPNRAKSMVNAWGIVPFDGKFWIAANGSGDVVILDGKGVPSRETPKSGQIHLEEGITGVAVTGAKADDTAFQIHTAKDCKPAQLLFASETGKLFGVNPELSTKRGFVVVDRSSAGAIYKGVAVSHGSHDAYGSHDPLILATDFHNAHVDVFDANFKPVMTPSFEVVLGNPTTPIAPFNVMVLEDTVYITYAQQDADKEDDVPGVGFVVAFDLNGTPLGIAKEGALNAPWGLALAHDFGPFPNSLLVGNFGDGLITAIETPTNPTPGNVIELRQLGQLTDRSGEPIAIEGLWGISFGPSVDRARRDGLYFAAGPDDETNGLFGVIAPKSPHH